MSFISFIKSKLSKNKKDCVDNKEPKTYKLLDTFGCPECPQDCPTFLEREIHKKFQNAISSYNIIVVYGESRQGKTWTIERYCPVQLRIGCDASMTLEQIKKEMLHKVGRDVHTVEHSVTEEYSEGCGTTGSVGTEMLVSAGINASLSTSHSETLKTTYDTVDLTKNAVFIETIKRNLLKNTMYLIIFIIYHPMFNSSFAHS